MAGAFSGHLLNTFNNGAAGPSSSTIITSGAMSFDARAHGTHTPQAHFGFTPFPEDNTTSKQIAILQAKLNKKLGPEYISQRPGPGGGPRLTYAEGWKIINLANEVFGFNGWSSSIVSLTTDFVDYNEESKKFNVGVTAIVRVTLRDGAYHEDVGYGMLENGKSKAAALDKCKKEAITDALKRTLRNFGNLLGNCLYDKSFAQEVVKIKVPPAKFDKSELYRRPEFEERVPATPASHVQMAGLETPSNKREEPRVKVEPETPITYVPRHLRQEMAVAAPAPTRASVPPPQRLSTGTMDATVNRNAQKSNGLATPVQTPARVQRPPPPRAPPPRAVATSPLARAPGASECSVSSTEQTPAPARTASVSIGDQVTGDIGSANVTALNNTVVDDDDDLFPLSTQDGAFFASVDLGDGDLGRPIDFDEGTGGVSVLDASELEPELDGAAMPRSEPQVRDRAESGSRAGPCSVNARNEVQAQPTASTSNASGTRTGLSPPSSRATGVHLAPGTTPLVHFVPKPVPACVRTSGPQSGGPTTGVKRSADAMQMGSSTRPPIQGMGLAQRQQQQQQNSAPGPDPKRFKR